MGVRAVGLYVHVPFCASRCAYCTFVTSTEAALMPRTLAATTREVERLGRPGRRGLASLYLGGGTPSLVPPTALAPLFAAVREGFELAQDVEVTLEANPDDVTPERVAAWQRLGVNRVSVGVQSFADHALTMLNRRHTASQARGAVELCLAAGLTVSIDLILGLPRLRSEDLDATLETAVRLRPHHLSVYLLEMDKPHELARLAALHPDLFPDGDAAARQYLAAGRALVAAGYRHYEVSSFALAGFRARHNVRYWRSLPVLAAGVAAHGQAGRRRWANVDELASYLGALEAGRSPQAWSRRLEPDETLREGVMLGLRLARGVGVQAVRACAAACPAFGVRLGEFAALDLAREKNGRIRLTPRGWLLSNELFETLV